MFIYISLLSIFTENSFKFNLLLLTVKLWPKTNFMLVSFVFVRAKGKFQNNSIFGAFISTLKITMNFIEMNQ